MNDFPKPEAKLSTNFAPPATLFYVWTFSHHMDEWEPMGVFNTRADALFYEESLKDFYKSKKWTYAGAVVETTWQDFVNTARRAYLGKLSNQLDKMIGEK